MSVDNLVAPAETPDAVVSTYRRDQVGRAVRDWNSAPCILLVRQVPATEDSSAGATERRLLEARRRNYRSVLGQVVFATDQFILEHFDEADSERFSPIYNFGTPAVQTSRDSGRLPRTFNYSGSLLASAVDGSAFLRFKDAWDRYLRGSATLNGADRERLAHIVEFQFRDQIRQGYLVSLNTSADSMHPDRHQFSFSMFITSVSTYDRERVGAALSTAASAARSVASVASVFTGSALRPDIVGLRS